MYCDYRKFEDEVLHGYRRKSVVGLTYKVDDGVAEKCKKNISPVQRLTNGAKQYLYRLVHILLSWQRFDFFLVLRNYYCHVYQRFLIIK